MIRTILTTGHRRPFGSVPMMNVLAPRQNLSMESTSNSRVLGIGTVPVSYLLKANEKPFRFSGSLDLELSFEIDSTIRY